MPSSTLTVKPRTLPDVDLTGSPITLDLASSTEKGSQYRKSGDPLSLPFTIDYQYSLGNGNANDHCKVTVKYAQQNSTTKVITTCIAALDLSVPKDPSTWSANAIQDIIAYLCSAIGTSARRTAIASGVSP